MKGRSRKLGVVAAVVLVSVAVLGVNVLPTAAQEPPPPIASELLTGRAAFTDQVHLKIKLKHHGAKKRQVVTVRDPSRTVVARFTVQPGAQFPWHTHHGPVVVNMIEGELVYVDSRCAERTYAAGTAFVDPGQPHVHTAYNATDDVVVLMATFFAAPEQGPLVIPAAAPPSCS